LELQHFLDHWGYLALVVGTFLEGETIVLLGGFAAHRGYLDATGVALASFAGSFLGDQMYFFIGRYRGRAILHKYPVWADRARRVDRLVSRYHWPVILGFRFLYGFRTIAPLAIGTTGIPATKFAMLNAIGAVIWSIFFTTLGFALGEALSHFIDDIHRYELRLFALIALLGLVVYILILAMKRRKEIQITRRNLSNHSMHD